MSNIYTLFDLKYSGAFVGKELPIVVSEQIKDNEALLVYNKTEDRDELLVSQKTLSLIHAHKESGADALFKTIRVKKT